MRLLIALLFAVSALAQTTINGSRTILGAWDASGATSTRPAKIGTAAPDNGDCDASGEAGRIYIQTGDPASVAGQAWLCRQIGESTYGWQPLSYQTGTTAPATCVVGQVFFDTDATAGSNWYGCTSSNTWVSQSGGSTTTLPYWSLGAYTSGAAQGFIQNATYGLAFVLPAQITSAARFYLRLATADNDADWLYSVGIYNASKDLIATTGAVAGSAFGGSTGLITVAFTSSVTLTPGKYYFAMTSNCSSGCAAFSAYNGSFFTAASTGSGGTTSGGALNATITVTDSYTGISNAPWFAVTP